MSIKIEFIKNHEEYTVPLIKLTKSKNGKTGTATFIFIEPDVFKLIDNIKQEINGLYLIWDLKKIITTDIKIIFKDGKPFLLRAIFIFNNSQEWFNFLNFMNSYSKETGLWFSDEKYF